ncbi:hypothetical protein [Micromonospora craniellae]|uniref:Uncharacterized protein n=1 Tax=Micromonospora craniellae TaxID=2294034 RepID=A0A372G1W4_9ACTN|nr:hypothetical protein [Micromonospora craniellae]QOC89867.1 hypothetical protein ID554_16650 [Micromonospora craniellae]RFS47012.1 hypothetical protein D0Q02_07565 [Micromonospora craniellae]
MSGVVVVDGVQWWTTAYAVAQLRVDRARLADWVRRSRQAGHLAGAAPEDCPRCQSAGPGFPHVDPPVRRAGIFGYVGEQLLEAEVWTSEGTRGGVLRQDS